MHIAIHIQKIVVRCHCYLNSVLFNIFNKVFFPGNAGKEFREGSLWNIILVIKVFVSYSIIFCFLFVYTEILLSPITYSTCEIVINIFTMYERKTLAKDFRQLIIFQPECPNSCISVVKNLFMSNWIDLYKYSDHFSIYSGNK